MKFLIALLGLAFSSQVFAGDEPRSTKGVIATCHVCRYNRDLACVEFRLKPTTPQIVHAGSSYCFCSDDCRKAFIKKPERYIPKPKVPSSPDTRRPSVNR
jgi:YHS domain-containing protein